MSKESDIKAVKDALQQWMSSLDNGDLQGMLDTCDPEAITANENMPTTVGIDHIREKYEPRIQASTFESTFSTENLNFYGNFALIMGTFETKMTNKSTGESRIGNGRLALGYQRHPDGSWKMVFDMDNNAQ